MEITPKIQKAINMASQLHIGQTRKGGPDLPFIVHPFSVAWILANYTDNEDIIVAGLLHDVLEDVRGYKFDNLKNDFGEKIAKIVKEVSEDKDPDIQENPKTHAMPSLRLFCPAPENICTPAFCCRFL